jgi:ketosteroid isomerase-like protein
MARSTPQETVDAIREAINAGDVAAVMECFDEEAVFVSPGTRHEARGIAAVREAMSAFLETRPRLDATLELCVVADDVALLVSEWKLKARGDDDGPFNASGRTADVLKRGPDGLRRYAVDNPTATAW